MQEALAPRIAQPEDSELITEVVALAFVADPLWSWAMSRDDARIDHHSLIWAFFVDGALRFSSSWILGDGAAVSVWIPPGKSEMSAVQERRLRDCVDETLGDRARRFFDLLAQMEDSHPRDVDHFYLSLLGTHPSSRGNGVGMRLLSHDLDLIDAEHRAAYLESSNPINDDRYRSVGFQTHGQFQVPNGGPMVTTMWRSAR
jgi:GNAT superfamily N-acetyltransferase